MHMTVILDFPALVFASSFIVLCLSALVGDFVRKRRHPMGDRDRGDLAVVQGAAVTLLSLLIGFSFSMAISRYEQRKTFEEAEANAIGTEYVRADLLPAADGTKVRTLLKRYVDERILYYTTRDLDEVREIDARTAKLQAELWSAVRAPARANPTPLTALVVWGMNDVLNSQGYTQAAWWNRIPTAAWLLMVMIAVCCNVLVGYRAHNFRQEAIVLLVLPLVVSISFFLIADIDSPRGGLIRVSPQNLVALAESLRPPIAKP